MTIKSIFVRFVALGALVLPMVAVPVAAHAQSMRDLERLIDRRQEKKNEWRNIAYAAGALGVLGLLRKDRTLFFVGAAGALYSLHRYEQDRKSQSRLQRARAAYFSRGYFTRDGDRYERHLVTRDGERYYQFRKDNGRHNGWSKGKGHKKHKGRKHGH